MGRLIVIEGLDGSGKATQSALLQRALQGQGIDSRSISFPNYASPARALVRMYLGGEFGSRPEDVNAYAASAFYAVDRFASFKTDWGGFYEGGGVLVADRYTTSNAVHQCSKLPRADWDAYLDWLFDFEYRKIGIPAPDAVLYLDVDPAVSQRLMTGRYAGREEKKDIHERDVAYLEKSRAAAAYCAGRLGWHTIRCCPDGVLRAPEEIASEVLAAARRAL